MNFFLHFFNCVDFICRLWVLGQHLEVARQGFSSAYSTNYQHHRRRRPRIDRAGGMSGVCQGGDEKAVKRFSPEANQFRLFSFWSRWCGTRRWIYGFISLKLDLAYCYHLNHNPRAHFWCKKHLAVRKILHGSFPVIKRKFFAALILIGASIFTVFNFYSMFATGYWLWWMI